MMIECLSIVQVISIREVMTIATQSGAEQLKTRRLTLNQRTSVLTIHIMILTIRVVAVNDSASSPCPLFPNGNRNMNLQNL